MQRPSELCHPIAAHGVRLRDPEHRVLIAVKRDRFAMALKVLARRLKIGEGAFARDELQMHEPTCRIVDKHEQGALRPSLLKPPVFGPIDLNQLTEAITSIPRLMNVLAAILPPRP